MSDEERKAIAARIEALQGQAVPASHETGRARC